MKNLTKPPVARKLAARHFCVLQLVFWLLVVSSFNNFKMHAWLPSTAVVAAFSIYVQPGEDAAKRGGWKPCIK